MESNVVVITGSSRGIGFHLAQEFLRAGHSVILNGRNMAQLDKAKMALADFSSSLFTIPGDVSVESSHRELLEKSLERFGKVDIWINNAGIPQPYLPFEKVDTTDIEKLIRINILGTLYGSRIILEHFRKQGFGSLYNMEGFGSNGRVMEKLTLYGSSKRTVNYFNRALYREVKGSGIVIGGINPGMVRTDFIQVGRDFKNEKEKSRYEKVLRILAEDPGPVSQFIVRSILKNKKDFNTINYLSGLKLIWKIFRLSFS